MDTALSRPSGHVLVKPEDRSLQVCRLRHLSQDNHHCQLHRLDQVDLCGMCSMLRHRRRRRLLTVLLLVLVLQSSLPVVEVVDWLHPWCEPHVVIARR